MRFIGGILAVIFIITTTVALSGCAGSRRSIQRTAADEATDLSGRWNDTDSRLTAEAMVQDLLGQGWLQEFSDKHGGEKPRVVVGTIRNKSHEHIPVDTFMVDLERSLTNSRKVRFVASGAARQEVRDERVDQARNASDETMKGPGQELGADYMLQGTLNSIIDAVEGQRVVFYQVDLDLTDVASNEKVWFGQKKIKKMVEQAGATW